MTTKPRLPIKLDSTTNGEYAPLPVSRMVRNANRLAAQRIADAARRTDIPRRRFLAGLCGAATTLLTLNEAFAAHGFNGGRFRVRKEGTFDLAAAEDTLAGNEFIFDVQTHMVNPAGKWRANHGKYWEQILPRFPQGSCGNADPVDCFSADYYLEHIFVDSDTDLAVLSFVPETPAGNPLDIQEADRARTLVSQMEDGAHRLLLHGMVVPNLQPYRDQHALMETAVRDWRIAAWKVYTQWGPQRMGWELDDPEIGIPFIEKARELGIRNICIHKGLSFSGFPKQFAGCADVGRAARRYPDMNFIIYHSGFERGTNGGAYDPNSGALGVDSLIKSLDDNDIAPNSNVYAELGSTWRIVMANPDLAAHTIGKLLKYVGEDRVLWGTDSIWYGSPQDQVQAFRAFEIADELHDAHGYPDLTPALKAKVFGANGAAVYGVDAREFEQRAAVDAIARRRLAAREDPHPSLETFGPKTMREFRALQAERKGFPV